MTFCASQAVEILPNDFDPLSTRYEFTPTVHLIIRQVCAAVNVRITHLLVNHICNYSIFDICIMPGTFMESTDMITPSYSSDC